MEAAAVLYEAAEWAAATQWAAARSATAPVLGAAAD